MSSEATADPSASAEVIELSFPASSKFIRLSRLAAASVAAELDFDVEEVDDLRVAVDEAVTLLVGGGHRETVTLRLQITEEKLTVQGECRGPSVGAVEVSDLVEAILSATTDRYRFETVAGQRQFSLEKQRRDAADPPAPMGERPERDRP